MIQSSEMIEFCNYIQPIIKGCAGFIKTDGYFTHIPGCIMMISMDQTVFSFVKIPLNVDIVLSGNINRFLGLTDEEKDDPIRSLYYFGYNILMNKMINTYKNFENISRSRTPVLSEDDCYNLEGFTEAVAGSGISFINVSDGQYNYRLYASKSITPLNKADTCKLDIYPYESDNFVMIPNQRTVRFTVYKKKFNLVVEIFYNILVI